MKFVVCTFDFSGLGWALMLKSEGHNVILAYENPDIEEKDKAEQDAFDMVGDGLVECEEMKDIFDKRSKYKDAYWVFDSNHLWEYGDKLRKAGFKVWGASELSSKMEHDRDFGVSIAKKAGLDIPETKEFSDSNEAISFLESNPDTSYVCKPDASEAHLTYVPQAETPEAANRELRAYLKSIDISGDFILQEKIKGVEADIECFFFNGKPYFAWVDLECKRKNSGDKGELIGCSQNTGFIVDLDSPLVHATVGKLFSFCQAQKYTGFGDVNVILADNETYFLEVCWRFGYNAHPTLFKTLLLSQFGETLAKMIDGNTNGFYQNFRRGFGSSLLMYLDHPTMGFPIYVSKDITDRFYPYESYQDETCEDKEQDFCLSGYGIEVGVICGFGYTMEDSAKDALSNALKVNFPSCAYREDLPERNYPSSPIKRYEALCAMKLL